MKAAMVDVASLWNMGKLMGFERIGYARLFEFLQSIGTPKNFGRQPVAAFTTTVPDYAFRMAEGAGFKVRRTSPGHDDSILIEEMEPLVYPKTTELVLVSADGGYIPTCDIKAAVGMKIYWVAARLSQNGTPIMGLELEKRLSNGAYEFVDLEPHARKVFFN